MPDHINVGAADENNNVLPRPRRKRRRSSLDADEAPQWFKIYQESAERMHNERMALETRRVKALEDLVNLIKEKH